MRSRVGGLLALGALSCLALAACTSSSAAPAGPNGSASRTVTVGVLTDSTGLGASSDVGSVQGVEAGIAAASQQGYKIKYVVADTMTSPTGALTAAEQLVEQDHVLAVITTSAVTFGAAPFLLSHGVPVLGSDQDGPEWLSDPNMFSVFGRQDTTKVSTTIGQFMKMEGVTNVGTLGYSISPLSSDAAKTYALSAESAGLKAGYVNPVFTFGSTDVGPVVLAMKAAGVNGVVPSVTTSTSLALVTALRQEKVPVKVALLPTGYGGDLTQGGKATLQSAQGVYFYLIYEPVEMHTAATTHFENTLHEVGASGDPTFAAYLAYAGVDMLVRGLEAAGPDVTQASLIKALRTVHDYSAAGLLGAHTIDLGSKATFVSGPDNCLYFVKLSGTSFELIPGADPLCGSAVAGKSISP
jgi:branched-chain amino acid transport system substrate-binding protein